MSMKAFWDRFSTGRSTNTLTCTSCRTIISTTDDEFNELLLFFPQRHHDSDQDCTLEDLIAHYCETELIEDYECNICKWQRMTLTKETAITTCPPILCVVLCPTKQDGGIIKSSVQFPVSGSNITEDDLQYNLVGIIHYTPCGSDHGHYTSICCS